MPLTTTYSRYLDEATFPGAVRALERALASRSALLALDEERADEPLSPGKWSRKEVLGHLVDSAANNLQRFVRAQIPAHLEGGVLRLPSYTQDDWVRVGAYSERAWRDLVSLWVELNRHVVHVLAHAERGSLETRCAIGEAAPVSLEALIVDYAGHLQHHLAQILAG